MTFQLTQSRPILNEKAKLNTSILLKYSNLPNLPPPFAPERLYRKYKESIWNANTAQAVYQVKHETDLLCNRILNLNDAHTRQACFQELVKTSALGSVFSDLQKCGSQQEEIIVLTAKTALAIKLLTITNESRDYSSLSTKLQNLIAFKAALTRGERFQNQDPRLQIACDIATEVHDTIFKNSRFNRFVSEAQSLVASHRKKLLRNHTEMSDELRLAARSSGLLASISYMFATEPTSRHIKAAKHFGIMAAIASHTEIEYSAIENKVTRQLFIHHSRKCFRSLIENERDAYRALVHRWGKLGIAEEIISLSQVNPPFNPRGTTQSVSPDAIRITTQHGYYWGPLFIQPRVGKGGETILTFKLRTMRALGKDNTSSKVDLTTGKELHSSRITSTGRFLRKYFLDELPQLINLAKGQLTFVGMRPLTQPDVEKLSSQLREKYLQYGPSFLGVTYAFSGKATAEDPNCEKQREAFIAEFYRSLELHPFRTTLQYGARVLWGIFIEGKRGI